MVNYKEKILKLWMMVSIPILFGLILTGPYQATVKSNSGRDYASYHYAVQSVFLGENPYVVGNLNRLAKEEGTRKSVHPFFYPPPSILSVLWTAPLSLKTGSLLYFWLNQLFFIGNLWIIHKWRQLPWVTLLTVSIFLWPILDSMKMGQMNLFVGLFVTIAVRFQSGSSLAVAAMTKMSPALIFFTWISKGSVKPILYCIGGCILLSLVTLPFLNLQQQLDFYFNVLPGFSSGSYHGLKVPIDIPANHSIPDLFNQLFPSNNRTILSKNAKVLSSITNVTLVVSIMFLSRKYRRIKSGHLVPCAAVCLMLIVPVYCYEHHLALMLLPVTICFDKLRRRPFAWNCTAWIILMFGGMPLFILRWIQKKLPMIEWYIQESKFLFIVVVALYCIWEAHQEWISLDSKSE